MTLSRLVDFDGTMVLTPMVAMVPELAREIERMRLESGLSIEELLASLHEQRERHHEERNATTATFPAGPSGGAGSASG